MQTQSSEAENEALRDASICNFNGTTCSFLSRDQLYQSYSMYSSTDL